MKKKAAKHRKRGGMTKAMREADKRAMDRYIERWARHLILVDADDVRRLTEDEIQEAVYGKAGRRKRAISKR